MHGTSQFKPLDLEIPSKPTVHISVAEGDIGTDKHCSVHYDRSQHRKLYYESLEGAHPSRFEMIPSKLERISKYKRSPNISIDKYSRRGQLFEVKYNQDRSKAKRMRPPSGIAVYYDVVRSKEHTLKRIDNAPVFKKGPERSTGIIKHEYAKEGVDQLEIVDAKAILEQHKYTRSAKALDFGRQRGREDNLVYYINEGNNLGEQENTFFSKFRIKDMLDSLNTSAFNTEVSTKHFVQSDMSRSPKFGKGGTISYKSLFVKDPTQMSLEEKILAGAFKPFA